MQALGKLLCLLGFILITLFLWPENSTSEKSSGKESPSDQAKVTFLQGRAEVLPKGETTWKLLQVGSILSRDDEVRTGDKARIEIQLPDRSVLRFDQQTTFKMKTLFFDAREGSREMKVEMIAGKTWANVRKAFGSKRTFEVASANAVAGVRDTIWRMNVAEDKTTLVRVYEGVVEVYHPFVKPDYKPEEEGFKAPREVKGPQEVPPPYTEVSKEEWERIVLTQMMQVIVPPVGKPEKPVTFSPEDDQKEEWVRWNQQRDKEVRP
ncbi:MAG: FecR domain-containing protein [Deltaproteobacteria bacterium]|nr:FecR domain-containing protein [Deltaproteobacteria bacterium]